MVGKMGIIRMLSWNNFEYRYIFGRCDLYVGSSIISFINNIGIILIFLIFNVVLFN